MSNHTEVIKESIDSLLEGKAAEMKDNIEYVIAEKVTALLEEKKKQIAASIFPKGE